MPTPAVTLRIRRFRRQFGIAAPRVAVRSHLPWHWYVLIGLVIAVVLGGAGWFLAQRGERAELLREIDGLNERLSVMGEELQGLRGSVGTEQSGIQMERATRQQLQARVRALEAENSTLKEEIAFFERLVPAAGSESTLRIDRFQVAREADEGVYRYRLLIGFVASKQVRDFKGRLQLHVTYVVGGQEQILVLPEQGAGAKEYLIDVRHFLRKEGVVKIPPVARLKGIEARLYQGDTLRTRRNATI